MCKVWNKRNPNTPVNAVYVGRPSKWGNPFSHLNGTLAKYKVATRDEAVDEYESQLLRWFEKDPEAKGRLQAELRGRDLVCWCAPARCHADVLLKYANE